MEETVDTIARLVKLLDANGFSVLELQAHRRGLMADSGIIGVGLTVRDRWAEERHAKANGS